MIGWLWCGAGLATLPTVQPSPRSRLGPLLARSELIRSSAGGVTSNPWAARKTALLDGGKAAGTVGIAVGAAVLSGPALAVVGTVAGVATLRALAARRRRSQRTEARRCLRAIVSAVSDECDAGASWGDALRRAAEGAGPYRAALTAAAAAGAGGGPFSEVGDVADDLGPLLTAHVVASQAGSSSTALLSGLRADLEADDMVRSEVESALAGPATSSVVLASLPLVGLALGAAMGADPLRVLLHSGVGAACLYVGLGLELAGLWWVRTLRARAEPG